MTNYATMFKTIGVKFALTSHIVILHCHRNHISIQEKSWASWDTLFFHHESGFCFPKLCRKCAFLPLFNVPSITTSAGWEQSGVFFPALFVAPVCGVTSLSWQRDCERGGKTFRKKRRKRQKCSKAAKQHSQVLAEPLFSTHRLRYATMHSKYSEEWLKQTQGKQIWTRYSSWLSCFLLPSLHVICCPSAFLPVFFF